MSGWTKKGGLYFVLLFGAVDLLADFSYEGARSVSGPFLAGAGRSALVAGLVGGFGRAVGLYAAAGFGILGQQVAAVIGQITVLGYLLQMSG